MGVVKRIGRASDNSAGIVISIFLLAMIAFSAFVWLAASAHEERLAVKNAERKSRTVSESIFGRTVEHDGHWWVVWNHSDFVNHHPGCPCGKLNPRKMIEETEVQIDK